MHTQYLTIEGDIEFPKVPSANQMPGKILEAKHIGRFGSLPQFHLARTWTMSVPLCSTILVLQS
jgi:hypothetical protein